MTSDFDLVIVGSGPAGVSAAFPLVEAGLRVLMVDGGRHATIPPPNTPFLHARSVDSNQWKWMIGEDFQALRKHDAVSPKLRAPTQDYVFENFEAANHIDAEGFIAVGSLARGGLSNAWGCGVSRMSDSELSLLPFHEQDIKRSYAAVAMRIGISGREDDDLADYFGVDPWAQAGVPLDGGHGYLLGQYSKHRNTLAALGFRLGRTRVAVLTENREERLACDRTGNCLWGCDRRALYSSADELSILKKYPNFSYQSGFLVEGIEKSDGRWSVVGVKLGENERFAVTAEKVILAAGTLATTRLALKALRLKTPVRLLSSPTAAFLLWLPRRIGAARENAFAMGQLAFVLTMEQGVKAFGATFGTTGIPVSEFVRHLPLRRRYGVDVLSALLSSCVVGNFFLPGDLTAAHVRLKDDFSLKVEGKYSDQVPGIMNNAARSLRKAFARLGAFMLPMSFTVGRPGGDIHYAGTLPMREAPVEGETNASGELYGLGGVHVVDGACLPTLTEKSHTLTIMANADRIGRILAARWYNGAPK